MRHVLITGGAGFIGSHLCDAFLARGYAVSALDNFVTGRRKNLDQAARNSSFHFLEWDVCNAIPEERLPLLGTHGLDGVLHFACPASPIDFSRIPFEILKVDSLGTMRTVELALNFSARYLLASTSEVYGDPLVHPQKEEYWGNVNPQGPRACYDEAKRFAEAYVSTAIRGEGIRGELNAAVARIFNTYGPRMRVDDGRVVPELCAQGIQGVPLTVHGSGKQTRSFCFVSDLVEGLVGLFESDSRETMNLGNPREQTVLEFAEEVRAMTGSRSEIRHLPGREDDPKRRCPDISRARARLGWSPRVDLREGLRRSIDYFKSELERE